ncbi:uncharacterized protein HMPREF1541_00707 [Cyphellophora europaea CBS 101466]|uniref:Uncharacterized protein n=1 Tax=Cyphellophora europaea (strain CBS 101466) TaxID=1220924 RepID=W2SCV1_CYPE1|nr:uncharacterized protein HMPREF1541_00707 [Cyphellophora europaea CBS 101466]ETN46522.1 hypothetical protein HMPREF1541_00707 [Cyphellophora europaea CBS 101466]
MPSEIIFFDLPSKNGRAWSLNPWKTRFVLNYKSIPYRTQWTEYPDVKPTLEKLVPPNKPGQIADYTIPAITLPSGTSLMDSFTIVEHLEAEYPSPPLHLSDPRLSTITNDLWPPIMKALRPVYVPRVGLTLLNPPSAEYFRRTREKAFNCTLEALRDDPEQGGERAWDKARPWLQKMAALYREDGGGPFLRGSEVSYADFVVLGLLLMFDRLGVLGDLVKTGGEEFQQLWDASAEWRKRDDH